MERINLAWDGSGGAAQEILRTLLNCAPPGWASTFLPRALKWPQVPILSQVLAQLLAGRRESQGFSLRVL